jgi:uncharacterized membrane protein
MPKLPARIAAVAWLALFGLCFVWELWLAPLRAGGSWLWLKALPIALTLPGVLRGNPGSLQMALLTSTLYLMEAAVRVFEPWPARGLAWAELILVCVFFCAAVAALRPLKRAAKARAALARDTQASEATR